MSGRLEGPMAQAFPWPRSFKVGSQFQNNGVTEQCNGWEWLSAEAARQAKPGEGRGRCSRGMGNITRRNVGTLAGG